jgi:hypothetical protein
MAYKLKGKKQKKFEIYTRFCRRHKGDFKTTSRFSKICPACIKINVSKRRPAWITDTDTIKFIRKELRKQLR